MEPPVSMQERYKAAMVLAGVGDAMGYRNGSWEFNMSGPNIHADLKREFGGIEGIDISGWSVSDDQVMNLHGAEALVSSYESVEELYQLIANQYIESFKDMGGRAAGPTTANSVRLLKKRAKWDCIPYSRSGGGCGAAMRSMCIGLRFPGEQKRDELIAVSLESARMTHNHPTGMFGSLAGALFVSYALEGVPVVMWGRQLVEDILPRAYKYLEKQKRDWEEYQEDLRYFEKVWRDFLALRNLLYATPTTTPVFPGKYGVVERDGYYSSVSFQGWGGASGHDAPLIAYDALLGAGDNWIELALRGILHGGDNDSTGVMCAAWFGALYGFKGVPLKNYQNLEYRERAEHVAAKLYNLAYGTLSLVSITATQSFSGSQQSDPIAVRQAITSSPRKRAASSAEASPPASLKSSK